MALHIVSLPSMTVSSGSTTSNGVVTGGDAWGLAIYSPASTSSVTVEVEPTSSGAAWVVLQSGGTDVTIAASKGTVINPVPFKQMRVTSTGALDAELSWTLTKSMLL